MNAPHHTFPDIAAENTRAVLRAATVELNDLQRLPWMLRCYGQGTCTIGRGVPKYYAHEIDARRTAAVWIKTGVSPADQREVR